MMRFRIEDRSKCDSLQHALHGGGVRNDVDQALSCVKTAPKIVVLRRERLNPSWTSRLGAPLLAFVLTVAPSVSPVHAVEDARKVSVVSFGLFGDQGVFRSEATGAAQVVPMPTIRRSAAGTRPGGRISAMPFSTSHSGKLKA
jgi:hypothetical protein